MSDDEALDILREVLGQVAPEADLDGLAPGEALTEGLDLDSIDFLNLVIGVHERTGIDTPERDYPRLATLEGWVAYLVATGPPAG